MGGGGRTAARRALSPPLAWITRPSRLLLRALSKVTLRVAPTAIHDGIRHLQIGNHLIAAVATHHHHLSVEGGLLMGRHLWWLLVMLLHLLFVPLGQHLVDELGGLGLVLGVTC